MSGSPALLANDGHSAIAAAGRFPIDYDEQKVAKHPTSLSKILNAILPSFLFPTPPKPAKASSNIAALDGLRGVACWVVLNSHWACAVDDPWENDVAERSQGFMWKPFVSLVWDAESMVNIFFVISGYVLSQKSLKMIHSDQSIQKTIASSIFRRAFRLFLPAIAAIFIITILAQMRIFEGARSNFEAFEGLLREQPPTMEPTFASQITGAFREVRVLLSASLPGADSFDGLFDHDKHLWTIPVEFKCSMVLFLVLTGTSLLKTGWRLIIHFCITYYCLLNDFRNASLFIGGMVLAELDIIRRRPGAFPGTGFHGSGFTLPLFLSKYPRSPRFATLSWIGAFILGLFIMGVPLVEPVTMQPHAWLASLLPDMWDKNKVLRAIGSIMTTWACINSPAISRIFASRLAEYLGKISFALYLSHGMVIRSLGYVVIGFFRRVMGTTTREDTNLRQFLFIWILSYVIMLPFWFWAAELFCKFIDLPSVTFSRWIEQRMSRPGQTKA
ncbi:hypothetical protein B0A52_06383 [Exophiala mesophila]|uniref:Acyltransferase 3 domain-containing protein n=1 Tax=Exophiala mesophila TaxID=212818 RepID=A0A438N1Y0_EXOME|nr:hypothetical protein B0A52_06383 [Exophiala mesophila]